MTLKRYKHLQTAFILLVFVLAIRWDNVRADAHLPVVLLRIEIAGEDQLSEFAALAIPVYAQLWDAQGGTYLLAGPDQEQWALIESSGFTYRLLDTDPGGADYFLVYKSGPDVKFQMPAGVVVLETTDRHLLIRALPEEAEELSRSGFEIRHLWLEKLVLSTPAAQLQSAAQLQGSAAITPDPAILDMIQQVSSTTAYNYVGNLSGAWSVMVNDNPYTIATRYSYAEIPIKKATRFVYEHFNGLGLNAYYDHYYLYGYERRSVVAEQPGVTNPGCIVLLTGHLDSISDNPYYKAPGADDNASGSTGVLIAADILHQYSFECTIRYVLFTGEEQGYWGSKAYAADVYAAGENVVAVVNLDMLGYNGDSYRVIELHARPGNAGDLAIANLFKGVIQAYDINLTTQVLDDGLSFSDHSPFWSKGYSAILCIEDWYGDHTPDYHKTTDLLGTLDISYLKNYIRAAVGTVAHLATYIPPEPEPSSIFYFPLVFK